MIGNYKLKKEEEEENKRTTYDPECSPQASTTKIYIFIYIYNLS